MIYRQLNIKYLATVALLFCSLFIFAAPNPNNGKTLFKTKCATCHNGNMKADMTGPALGGAEERWEGKEELLYDWIRNSQQVITSGDAYAVKLFNDWNKSVMQAFPELTNENIDDILLYVDNMYIYGCTEPPCADPDDGTLDDAEEEAGFNWLYALLFGLLAILALVLVRITSNLNHMAEVKAGRGIARRTLLEVLTSKSVVSFAIFAAVVFGGFTTVNNAINFGRQQDYAPVQPIKFSHETHAGINKIDCQYCHDGARRSKHAVIPAVNTCMNCHKAINNGSTYGKTEISKIYAASGYDPVGNNYYDDYDNMNKDTLVKNMKTWLEAEHVKAGKSEKEYRGKVNEQLDEITPYIQAPMEWVRIHNLPDHAYFNHAQHVVAGGVECQTCHGAVEEMEVMSQYAPLSMGWCVNCHRQTEVQFADNPYYESFEQYHKDIKSGKMDKVTVEDIGGLECQKCHY